MSEFTGKGFEPTAKERAEVLRTPGSNYCESVFREYRTKGQSAEDAIAAVYLTGAAVTSAEAVVDVNDLNIKANIIYSQEKAAGRHHREALDEVFLAGYVAGVQGSFS